MRRSRLLSVLGLVTALGVAGCDSDSDESGGGGDGSTSTSGPTSGSATTTPTTATATATASASGTTASTTSSAESSTGDPSETGTTTSDGGSSGSGGVVGCQPQMSKLAIDRWRLGADDRMPTFAEIARPLLDLDSTHHSVGGLSDLPDPQAGGSAFIEDPDGGGIDIECSVWDQDCVDGEKCAAWSNDGGSAWNATRCVPIDPDPVGVGEVCTVEGSGVSGLDNCDATSMCFNVDNETNEGTCVALCEGSEQAPTCAPEATACSISNQGVLILCLPICNPLADECGEGEGCFPVGGTFQCAPVAGGSGPGEPCEFINGCEDGTACVSPDIVPGCPAGSGGCCTSYCSIGDDTACIEGQECLPWFEMGQEPDACLEGVGICSTP